MDNQRLKRCGSQPTHRLSYRPMCAKELYCKVKKKRSHNRKSSARHILPCALLFVHISFINPCYNYDIIQYRKRTPHRAPCMLKRCWAPAWCSPVILRNARGRGLPSNCRPAARLHRPCQESHDLPGVGLLRYRKRAHRLYLHQRHRQRLYRLKRPERRLCVRPLRGLHQHSIVNLENAPDREKSSAFFFIPPLSIVGPCAAKGQKPPDRWPRTRENRLR